jgi:hypothetical protein
MLNARVIATLVVCGVCAVPSRASAQDNGLVQLMLSHFVQNIVLAQTPGGSGVAAHTPVFESGPEVATVTALVRQVAQQIGAQVSNAPLGSSSGGFTYRFDPSTGTFTRSTETFGPAFAERALTAGRGKFAFGMNFQRSRYSSLDEFDLEEGDITFFLPHEQLDPPSFIQGDVIEAAVNMELTSRTTVFFGNYGVTDRLDVGLVVPFQSVSMNLTYAATIRDFSTGGTAPGTHLFANGQRSQDFSASASASGIGDLVVRAKYALPSQGATGLALGVDVALPTGSEDDMLGTGATQARVFLIASTTRGRLSPHVNVGATLAGGSDTASHQFNYVGGAEYAAHPRVTFTGDLIGRTLFDANRIVSDEIVHEFRQGATFPLQTAELETVAVESGSLTQVLGTVGAKLNPGGNLLISVHGVFQLTSGGLRRGFTPVFGFDYSF